MPFASPLACLCLCKHAPLELKAIMNQTYLELTIMSYMIRL
jgi:hypothetical protein